MMIDRSIKLRLHAVVFLALCSTGLAGTGLAGTGLAGEAGPSESQDPAKQLSNPIANLASLPLQYNWAQGVGPNDDLRFVLNFQPVVPFSLNENWNLISRVILPIVSQPALVPGGAPTSGMGDIVLPRKS